MPAVTMLCAHAQTCMHTHVYTCMLAHMHTHHAHSTHAHPSMHTLGDRGRIAATGGRLDDPQKKTVHAPKWLQKTGEVEGHGGEVAASWLPVHTSDEGMRCCFGAVTATPLSSAGTPSTDMESSVTSAPTLTLETRGGQARGAGRTGSSGAQARSVCTPLRRVLTLVSANTQSENGRPVRGWVGALACISLMR